MDATALEHTGESVRCEQCGYSRQGLPDGAKCPECGEPAPVGLATHELRDAMAAAVARTTGERAWLATVAVGLCLLVWSSLAALHVALIMPIQEASLPAVNFPGPKMWAASLMQRSIGALPGTRGVAGTIAALGCVLAAWLITEPRSLQVGDEHAFSLRRLARWSAVVLMGMAVGLLLGGYTVSRWNGYDRWGTVLLLVALVELPTGTLLYLYLRQLSDMLHDRRAAMLMRASVWLVPITGVGSIVMTLTEHLWTRGIPVHWQIAQAAYGALALACGVVTSVAVGRLAITALTTASREWFMQASRSAPRVWAMLRRAVQVVRSDPARWAIVLGIIWWLWVLGPLVESGLSSYVRRGVGESVPVLNFPGPKVWASPLVLGTSWAGKRHIMLSLLTIWLMTSRWRDGRYQPQRRLMARWVAILMFGMTSAFVLVSPWLSGRHMESERLAILLVLAEAPATLLLYLHLSSVARDVGAERLGMLLARLGIAAAGLIVMPITLLALSAPLYAWRHSVVVHLLCGMYVTTAIAVGLLALSAMLKLAWAVAVAPPRLIQRTGADGCIAG